MARHIIPRNEHGQFAGDNIDAICEKCEALAEELYISFPDVDIFDLNSMANMIFNFTGSRTLVHARLGSYSWSDIKHFSYKDKPWYLDSCDDAYDSSFCDIYAKIEPFEGKIAEEE